MNTSKPPVNKILIASKQTNKLSPKNKDKQAQTETNKKVENKSSQHKLEMNCLQNCSSWILKVSIKENNSQISNNNTVNESNSNLETSFKETSINLSTSNIKYNEAIKLSGKNYFLNKLMLNYSALLTDFNYFKVSASFLDIFFVKSMQQNKDKIEFIKINPSFPLNFSLLADFDRSGLNDKKDYLKFFVDFDLSKNDSFAKKLDKLNSNNNSSLTEVIELQLQSNIHSQSFFGFDNIIQINYIRMSELIKLRVETILKNLVGEENLQEAMQKIKTDLKESYCSLIENDNFTLGVIFRVDDVIDIVKSFNMSRIRIVKFLLELNLPIKIVKNEDLEVHHIVNNYNYSILKPGYYSKSNLLSKTTSNSNSQSNMSNINQQNSLVNSKTLSKEKLDRNNIPKSSNTNICNNNKPEDQLGIITSCNNKINNSNSKPNIPTSKPPTNTSNHALLNNQVNVNSNSSLHRNRNSFSIPFSNMNLLKGDSNNNSQSNFNSKLENLKNNQNNNSHSSLNANQQNLHLSNNKQISNNNSNSNFTKEPVKLLPTHHSKKNSLHDLQNQAIFPNTSYKHLQNNNSNLNMSNTNKSLNMNTLNVPSIVNKSDLNVSNSQSSLNSSLLYGLRNTNSPYVGIPGETNNNNSITNNNNNVFFNPHQLGVYNLGLFTSNLNNMNNNNNNAANSFNHSNQNTMSNMHADRKMSTNSSNKYVNLNIINNGNNFKTNNSLLDNSNSSSQIINSTLNNNYINNYAFNSINNVSNQNFNTMNNNKQANNNMNNNNLQNIAYASVNGMNKVNQNNQNNNNFNNKSNIANNSNPFSPSTFKSPNINNFQQFMTNTSPLLDEVEELKLKTFFHSFKQISLKGVECYYKTPLQPPINEFAYNSSNISNLNTNDNTAYTPNINSSNYNCSNFSCNHEESLDNASSFFEKISLSNKDTYNKHNEKNKSNSLVYFPTISALYIEGSSYFSNVFNNFTMKKNDSITVENKESFNQEKNKDSLNMNTTNNSIIFNTSVNNSINDIKINNNSTNMNMKYLNSPNIDCLSHNLSASSIDSLFSIDDIPKPHYNRKLSGLNTKISYFEEASFYNRPNFNQKIEEIFNMYPELENWSLNEVSEKSWFAILWTPKASYYGANDVSFLVFYRFKNKYLSGNLKSLPIIGVLGNVINEDNQLFWFANPNATNVYDFKVQDEFMRSKSNYMFYAENAHAFVSSMKVTNFLDYNIIRSRVYEP